MKIRLKTAPWTVFPCWLYLRHHPVPRRSLETCTANLLWLSEYLIYYLRKTNRKKPLERQKNASTLFRFDSDFVMIESKGKDMCTFQQHHSECNSAIFDQDTFSNFRFSLERCVSNDIRNLFCTFSNARYVRSVVFCESVGDQPIDDISIQERIKESEKKIKQTLNSMLLWPDASQSGSFGAQMNCCFLR